MIDLRCECPKCNTNKFTPNFEESLKLFYDIFDNRKIIAPVTEPPEYPNKIAFKCLNPNCNYVEILSMEKALGLIRDYWAKLAWIHLSKEKNQAINFEEHFTRYIVIKGLDKIVTQRDLDQNQILKDYVDYIEKQYTEESNN